MQEPPGEDQVYRVLARKYRPSRFDDLIGQEALVRTLSNAIESGRLAQAFILTGVRGVGKTTTARIIARALNCVGPDGTGGPTIQPCGECENCRAIAQDRHVDVIEMDAASRTGVGDILELIEGVRYRPVAARRKVYIIDEVHMLSTSAFNALLKTLEEPPPHVVFVFATTELRKVPITVQSRCQRLTLRRVDEATLKEHFAAIAAQEKVTAEPAALALIARAADGSVRDGLSLLDQAIAHTGGEITAAQVAEMLGLADRTQVLDLFEAVMRGETADALAMLSAMYASGADPATVVTDLMELTHFLTRAKIVPDILDSAGTPEAERTRGRALAEGLSMPSLTRAWQMLLKGLRETQAAERPLQAAEMVLIRLAYARELPAPAELVEQLQGAEAADAGPANSSASGESGRQASARPLSLAHEDHRGGAALARQPQAVPEAAAETAVDESPIPREESPPEAMAKIPMPESFEALVKLLWDRKEGRLAFELSEHVHLVRYEPGAIELRAKAAAHRNLAGDLSGLLQAWTGQRWMVSLSEEAGAPTLGEQRRAAEAQEREAALTHPLVKAAMEVFPEAEFVAVRRKPGGAGGQESGGTAAKQGNDDA